MSRAACKAVYAGSIPTLASNISSPAPRSVVGRQAPWKVTATTTASLDGASTLWAKSRPPGGIRHFSANHVCLLRFIKEAQALAFSFDEVQDLPAREEGQHRNDAERLASLKLSVVRKRLWQLRCVKRALATLVEQCQCNVQIGLDSAKNLARSWNEVLVSARSAIVGATHSGPEPLSAAECSTGGLKAGGLGFDEATARGDT